MRGCRRPQGDHTPGRDDDVAAHRLLGEHPARRAAGRAELPRPAPDHLRRPCPPPSRAGGDRADARGGRLAPVGPARGDRGPAGAGPDAAPAGGAGRRGGTRADDRRRRPRARVGRTHRHAHLVLRAAGARRALPDVDAVPPGRRVRRRAPRRDEPLDAGVGLLHPRGAAQPDRLRSAARGLPARRGHLPCLRLEVHRGGRPRPPRSPTGKSAAPSWSTSSPTWSTPVSGSTRTSGRRPR